MAKPLLITYFFLNVNTVNKEEDIFKFKTPRRTEMQNGFGVIPQ